MLPDNESTLVIEYETHLNSAVTILNYRIYTRINHPQHNYQVGHTCHSDALLVAVASWTCLLPLKSALLPTKMKGMLLSPFTRKICSRNSWNINIIKRSKHIYRVAAAEPELLGRSPPQLLKIHRGSPLHSWNSCLWWLHNLLGQLCQECQSEPKYKVMLKHFLLPHQNWPPPHQVQLSSCRSQP